MSITDSEVARELLRVLDGNEAPTESDVAGAVEELQCAMDAMSALTLPAALIARSTEKPARAQLLGILMLAGAFADMIYGNDSDVYDHLQKSLSSVELLIKELIKENREAAIAAGNTNKEMS